MSAVLAALYSDQQTAESVREQLVRDGFPTDRVDVASLEDLGRAELVAAGTAGEKISFHLRQLFPDDDDAESVDYLARSVLQGHAILSVQPRGDVETRRALAILEQAQPLGLADHDLDKQSLERAASADEETLIPNVGKILPGSAP